MLRRILQQAGEFSKSALAMVMQGSGMGALYLCTSTLLAAILLAAYLVYAWDIDRDKWYKALAVLQGLDLTAMEQAAQDKVDRMSYDEELARRAARLREEEFQREVRQLTPAFTLPPEDPKPTPPPPPSDAERISAYQKRVKDDLAKARTAGRDELTRLIEDRGMDLEQAKAVIRKFWKDGFQNLVLTTLLDMADKRRGEILYAFDQDDPDELKDLNEILKDIGDGKPMTNIIEDAAKEP
jgi:hypothetical protein